MSARALTVFGTSTLLSIAAACSPRADDVRAHDPYLAGANVTRGREAVVRYGCGACHTLPGVPGAVGTVGPPLAELRQRAYVGGVLPNTAANLVRWIVGPKAVDSLTAMPNMGVGELDARDIALYLYSLK